MLKVITGPCVIENETITLQIAEAIKEISDRLNLDIIFKASFDKANRSSINGFRCVGFDEGIRIFKKIKAQFGLKTTTDIHVPEQADIIADCVDIIQIPALLCRQTDLLLAAAKTHRSLSIKKGQFLSPKEMSNVINKVSNVNPDQIFIIERGTCFGYQNLVVDMRGIQIMKDELGVEVIIDASHSIQLPGLGGDHSSGTPQYIPVIARAGIIAGAGGVFIETHPNPEKALSDGPNSLPLHKLEPLLKQLVLLHQTYNQFEVI